MLIKIVCSECGYTWEISDQAKRIVCPNPNCGAVFINTRQELVKPTNQSEDVEIPEIVQWGALLLVLSPFLLAVIGVACAVIYNGCKYGL